MRNYKSLICTSPFFHGIMGNWTIDSKAVSWTGMSYSFIISTSIKQVNVLKLILSVLFAFRSCCSEPTSRGPKELCMQVKQMSVMLQSQNKSIRETAGALGVAKSTVWYILRKTECTGELSNIKSPGQQWWMI